MAVLTRPTPTTQQQYQILTESTGGYLYWGRDYFSGINTYKLLRAEVVQSNPNGGGYTTRNLGLNANQLIRLSDLERLVNVNTSNTINSNAVIQNYQIKAYPNSNGSNYYLFSGNGSGGNSWTFYPENYKWPVQSNGTPDILIFSFSVTVLFIPGSASRSFTFETIATSYPSGRSTTYNIPVSTSPGPASQPPRTSTYGVTGRFRDLDYYDKVITFSISLKPR